jgi:hypothetical protein
MTFEADFSASLARRGVNLPVTSVPNRDILERGLNELNAFVDSLDFDTAQALNEVTREFPIKALLAEAGIAAELASVLMAFDQSQAPFSVSQLSALCSGLAGISLGGGGPSKRPDPPTIEAVVPIQFHLRNPEPRILVSWSTRDACDKYHFIWTDRIPPPKTIAGWREVELETGRGFGFSFNIPKTLGSTTYTFKVQGCDSRMLGHDNCSSFTIENSIQMPANTNSLRTFLSISGVPLARGIRSLGTSVVGAGIRAMMRVT